MTIYTQEELKNHIGHKIIVNLYSEGYVNEEATVECLTCHEILYSEFKYCPNCNAKMTMLGVCPKGCESK